MKRLNVDIPAELHAEWTRRLTGTHATTVLRNLVEGLVKQTRENPYLLAEIGAGRAFEVVLR